VTRGNTTGAQTGRSCKRGRPVFFSKGEKEAFRFSRHDIQIAAASRNSGMSPFRPGELRNSSGNPKELLEPDMRLTWRTTSTALGPSGGQGSAGSNMEEI
jgi:hypothetical protein